MVATGAVAPAPAPAAGAASAGAVDPASVEGTQARLTHVNLNENTVVGLELPGVCYSVQYHPVAGPGPHDSRYLFERFRELMTTFEPAELALDEGA